MATSLSIVRLTKAEYDALTPSQNTLYLVDGGGEWTMMLGAKKVSADSMTAGLAAKVVEDTAEYTQNASTAAAAANAFAKACGNAVVQSSESASMSTRAAASAIDAATGAADASAAAVSAAGASETLRDQTQAIYDSVIAVNTYNVGVAYAVGVTLTDTLLSVVWRDPQDNVQPDGAVLSYWGRTRLVMKMGGFPVNETDGTVLVENTVRDAYRNTPFTYDLGSLSGYCFALFTESTGGVWNAGSSAPRFTTDLLSWATVGLMSRTGTLHAAPGLAIGGVLPLECDTLYPLLQYRLAHIDYTGTYETVQDYMGDSTILHNSIWIPEYLPCRGTSKDADMCAFDASENAYAEATDEYFVQGRTYAVLNGSSYTDLVAGTDYLNGGSIPEWKAEHSTVYFKNNTSRVSNGNNIWKESNMRAMLNGTGPRGEYWAAQNPFDNLSDAGAYGQGWLTHVVPDLLSVIKPVNNYTARNTVGSANFGGGGGHDITFDRVWLPSMKEVFGTNIASQAEGYQWDYFLNVASAQVQRIQRDHNGTARNTWLRSPTASNVNNEYYINTSGASYYSNAYNSYAFLPAICVA